MRRRGLCERRCDRLQDHVRADARVRNHCQAYLPGTETYRDQEGGVSTARPIPCTPSGLTRTTTPNRGGSSAQFLLVGTSVRAVPLIETKKNLLSFIPIPYAMWPSQFFYLRLKKKFSSPLTLTPSQSLHHSAFSLAGSGVCL